MFELDLSLFCPCCIQEVQQCKIWDNVDNWHWYEETKSFQGLDAFSCHISRISSFDKMGCLYLQTKVFRVVNSLFLKSASLVSGFSTFAKPYLWWFTWGPGADGAAERDLAWHGGSNIRSSSASWQPWCHVRFQCERGYTWCIFIPSSSINVNKGTFIIQTCYTLLSAFVPGQGKTKRVLIFLLKMVETWNTLCLWQVHMSSFHGL